MNLAFADARWGVPQNDRNAALAIAIRIMMGSESIDFDLDCRGILPTALEREVQQRTKDQVAFTYGHEYAHHLCNHLSSPNVKFRNLRTQSGAIAAGEVVSYSHEIEYEADFYAIRNLADEPTYQGRLAASAFSVFLYLDVLEKFCTILGRKDDHTSDTHPKSLDRVWSLRNKLNARIGPKRMELETSIKNTESALLQLKALLANRGPHMFEFYGSVYLPNYKAKAGIDRIDF
jgi:hypothetical protein